MAHINHQDLQILIAAIADLHSDFDPQTLTARTLTATSKIINAADSVAFTGFRYDDGEYAGLMWTDGREYSAEEMEIFAAYVHENPLFDEFIIKHRTEALKITDLISPKKFERTTIYNEFYRRVGVSNQLVTPMRISDELLITCSINIESKDFSERDKTILMMLAPHLANTIRNALAYQRLSSALDANDCGIVALNSAGKPVFISDYARILFEKYFSGERLAMNALPESLRGWISEISSSAQSNEFAAPPSPLKIAHQTGELTVRLAFNRQTGERTLMLEEKRFVTPKLLMNLGITRREAEVLFWIACGKSDEAIANLCGISPRTIHKHVQNIYVKLGVETRTAAMLRALEVM